MNYPEKMPNSRYTRTLISEAEIVRQRMELDDQETRARNMGHNALEATAGEKRVLRELLGREGDKQE